MTTIEDIAREAGVSRATVSLVVRDSPLVAEQTRRRVRRAIDRLGYRPNRMAASLRSKRSYLLGLVVTDLTYPHYAQMAAGVEEAVEAAGYSLLVANSHDSLERERRHVESFSHYRADGVIVTPVHLDPAEADHLRALAEALPLVCLYRAVPGLVADFCGTDVYEATRRLVAYLAGDLGHRRIAMITTEVRNSTNPARLAGWRDELAARGLAAEDDMLVVVPRGGNSRSRGEEAARLLLEQRRAFSALVCVNDLLALGALRALHLAGVRVPADVSVAGMSGFADLSPPHALLTTMADDYRQIGREAGTLLLARIDGQRDDYPARRIVAAALRPGETTGPAGEAEFKVQSSTFKVDAARAPLNLEL